MPCYTLDSSGVLKLVSRTLPPDIDMPDANSTVAPTPTPAPVAPTPTPTPAPATTT